MQILHTKTHILDSDYSFSLQKNYLIIFYLIDITFTIDLSNFAKISKWQKQTKRKKGVNKNTKRR